MPGALEWGWRIVNDQDRLGTLRPVASAGPGADPITLEERTPGFATTYIRGYLSPSDGMNITWGIENILDKEYLEHLSLRLPASGPFARTAGACHLESHPTPESNLSIDIWAFARDCWSTTFRRASSIRTFRLTVFLLQVTSPLGGVEL